VTFRADIVYNALVYESRRFEATKLSVSTKVWYEPKPLDSVTTRLFFIYIRVCLEWVNIGTKKDGRSNGWKSLKRGSSLPEAKQVAKVVYREVCTEVKPDLRYVCTEEHWTILWAMRSDWGNNAPKSNFPKGRSTKISRCGSVGTRIFTLPREISRCRETSTRSQQAS